MNPNRIDALRRASRKLVRELGIVQLDRSLVGPTAQHCHALIEIGHKPGITISELAKLLLLSVSAASRLVQTMQEKGFVTFRDGLDKREKELYLSPEGNFELKNIDEYSNLKIEGAFEYISEDEQAQIVSAIQTYSQALETSRQSINRCKIFTLTTASSLRRQIVAMVEEIQKEEFQIPIDDEINSCILKAEESFYYNNSCNFWYAVDGRGAVIGCIGLKRLDAENGELKKFFVSKKFRGKEVAHKLLNVLLKAASKHGFRTLWLGTVEQFTRAHSFYNKYNFVRVEENELPQGFVKCPVDTLFFTRSVAEHSTQHQTRPKDQPLHHLLSLDV